MNAKQAHRLCTARRLISLLLCFSLLPCLTANMTAAEKASLQTMAGKQSKSVSRTAPVQKKGEKCLQGDKKNFIRWMSFDIPGSALYKAMNLDIKMHDTDDSVNWIEILAYLAAKYGGSWRMYRAKDMDALCETVKSGSSVTELAENLKSYSYYYDIYDAVLHGFLGVSGTGNEKRYGLVAYSPIARGYGYSHYDDFGDSRSFGFRRRHQGNDLLGCIGTPIVAVEDGFVESLGWNRYGGWRIGIRSFDRRRYYYYAHLRRNHPYVRTLKQGATVHAGDVIGYLGMTGYSDHENVNNMTKPHLHFGLQIIFDESQKECNNELWIDVYNLVNLLSSHQSAVKWDEKAGDYRTIQ